MAEELQRQLSPMKMPAVFHVDLADRLILLRKMDPSRKWESLDDRRFCRCCHKFISGRQIEVTRDLKAGRQVRLACPTNDCPSTVQDWVYSNEVALPPDAWGRRVIRVIDKTGEKFVVCGKQHPYSRRRHTQRIILDSESAA